MKNLKNYNQFNESKYDIRAKLKPKSDEELQKAKNKMEAEELLKQATDEGDIKGVQSALSRGADPSVNDNLAIRYASEKGHKDVVELLLNDKRVDPSDYNNQAILFASEKGHKEVVELLLNDERVDPTTCNNLAIRYASEDGNKEIVELLLTDERTDPSAVNNDAIKWASSNGHKEVIKLLLKDKRVSDKLTPSQFKKYQKKI